MEVFKCGLDSPIVETTKGKLRGYYFNGVNIFQGIRYAKAKRFEMPQPVDAWEGVKDAVSYGMICPVLSQPMPAGEVMTPHRFWPTSEHCQYLNVWTNSLDKEAKKPVMFWIHGGGFFSGSSIEQECYDGFNLAKMDDVVFVSVNHRLNAFGYLDIADFGIEKYKNACNVGMADLVEALRWVRDNIAQFGGDPENVTIFGQSGGGEKVTALGQIPEAEGLFAKAIVMSGVYMNGVVDNASEVDSKAFVEKIMDVLNIEDHDVEKLAKAPSAQYIWAVNKAIVYFDKQGKKVEWAPKANDYYTGSPLVSDFSEYSLSVPTLVGTVISEFGFPIPTAKRDTLSEEEREKIVKDFYGEGSDELLKAFKAVYPNTNIVYSTDLDTMFLPGTVKYVKKKASEAKAPVYNYMFAKIFDYDAGRAAWHCSDIPYFLHNAEMIPICHQTNYEFLNRVMSGAFVNFARTGNPNVEGLPKWQPCTKDHMVTMVFDDTCYTKENMQDELLPLVLKYKPPFEFKIPVEDPDSDEGGNAWVF